MTNLLSSLLGTARRAASVGVDDAEEEGRANYVSAMDLAAQQASVALIRENHPDHKIVAEESHSGDPDATPPAGPAWIIDPLDGTTNFLRGYPTHAPSVAFAMDGTPAVGAVSCAPSGNGAWENSELIEVSGVEGTGRALIGTGFPFKTEHLIVEYSAQLVRVLGASGGVGRGGGRRHRSLLPR
jgi:myo-inositol-1(or 4)-monophosphatase